MSLLYSVVFATRCRSNHHRLAVDALRHLRSPDAAAWRALLLHYHKEYLDGAKAPDEVFKDFKNHVLHVRDGEWGGAIEACEEWQRRMVRALQKRDFAQAAWSAGVMSHYYVDPIQPFHTHQTEEEGVIHRAVEWSFSKSYSTFQKLLETQLGGYPDVRVPDGDAWLAQMVRDGARASNPHYETIIEHYDFETGAKNPPAGLDQELREIIARLVGHAAVGLARILDKTFAEAAVKPPYVGEGLQAFFLALEAPIQGVLKLIDDAQARAEVAAQYAEFQRTGKVRTTLGEDDKVVRALYAAEVLKTPLSSLDAKWPREIGAKAARTPKPAPKPAPKPKPKAAPKAAAVAPKTPAAAAAPSPAAAPKAKPAPQPAASAPAQASPFTLDGNAPVVEAPSIGPKTSKRLETIGVRTVA
ncbi:MAG: zinc dependent phospholipase C family protein, partial [Hyphomonadaceae bacterium]